MDVEAIQRLFVDGMSAESGFDRFGNRRALWDVSRGCDNPVPVTRFSRQTGLAKNLRKPGYRPPMIELIFLTPCRKCSVCLNREARLWARRARIEIEQAERTWFGTLTLRPDAHIWVDAVASSTCWDFSQRSQSEKFRMQSKIVAAEVTKFLKRVREASSARFRYLLVSEVHDGADTSDFMRGRVHLHLLMHEFAGQPIRKALLEDQWRLGFSSWKLTGDPRAAWYVAKYISKAREARTRASLGYGLR